MKVTREHRAYLRRRIAPLDTDTRRRQYLAGDYSRVHRPTARHRAASGRGAAIPRRPGRRRRHRKARPDVGGPGCGNSRGHRRPDGTHHLVPRWPLNRVAVEWPPVGNEVCRSGATTGTHRAVAVARHGTHRNLTSAEMRPAIGGTAVLRCGSNPLTPNGIRSPSASGWAATPSVPVRSLARSPASSMRSPFSASGEPRP